jgi:Holliday junction resolvasome RuvABC endonuclease subunit
MDSQEIEVAGWQPSDMDAGDSPVGIKSQIVDTLETLQDNIQTLAETVHQSLQAHQPDEWSLELNIGFKGKTSPIPVILSGEASGAIKVTAKWKKASGEKTSER